MMRPPYKVLDLRDSPWVDGPGRTILQSATMVDEDSCKIMIGAFFNDSHEKHAYINEAERLRLDILPIKESSAFDRQVIRQILDAISRHSINILHSHDFRSNIFGLICAKRARIPIISTCHGWISNGIKGKIYTNIDKLSLRFFDEVISVSDTMRKQLLAMGIADDRISVIRNALIVDNYQPDRSRQILRDELGLSADTKIIANIGRLSPEKGQDIFLQAAQDLLKRYDKLCFVLIGIGPDKSRLEKLVSELGINDSVVFLGFRKDMHEIYNSIDLVVQSSYTEGMPNVVLESLLMKVPVVATAVGGTSEIIKAGATGVLIEPHNLPQLVDGIAGFLDMPGQYQVMAQAGSEFVGRNFDHNQRVTSLMNVYEKVMSRTYGPG